MVCEEASTRRGVEFGCVVELCSVLERGGGSVGASQKGDLMFRERIVCEVTAANGVGWES